MIAGNRVAVFATGSRRHGTRSVSSNEHRWRQNILFAAMIGIPLLFLTPKNTLALDGPAIVQSNCVSCHNINGPAPTTFEGLLNRKAPDLFYAGSKFNRPWLVEWLQNPKQIRPAGELYLNHIAVNDGEDSIAAASIKPCPVELNPGQAEVVAGYLMTLRDETMETGVIDAGKKFSKAKALRLFRKQLPCVGCHSVNWGKKTIGGISGPNLTEAGLRLNPDWVYARIKDPQYWDPRTWMPKIDLSHKKLELLTLFIGSMNSYRQDVAQASDSASPRMPTPLSKFVSPPNATIETERNYRLYCVQCHGSQGNGLGVNNTAGALSVSPRDYLLASEMSKLKDDEIKSAITLGGDAVQKSGLMPGWGNTLGEKQIDALVLYLRKLCQCEAGG